MPSNDPNLRSSLIKLAYEYPSIRDKVLPLVSPALDDCLKFAFVDLILHSKNNSGKIIVGVETTGETTLHWFDKISKKDFLEPFTQNIKMRVSSISLKEEKRSYIGRGVFKVEFGWSLPENSLTRKKGSTSHLKKIISEIVPPSSIFICRKE